MKLTSRTTGALLALLAFVAFCEAAGGQDRPLAGKTAEVRKDLHGDPLPPGAIARMGTVRFRQFFGFTRLAFAPDGKQLASLTWGVRLWDAATGRPLRNHDLPEGCKTGFALGFSARGQPLVLGTRSGYRYHHRAPQEEPLYAYSGPKDVKQDDRNVCLWDAVTGKELLKLDPGKGAKISGGALSPDGKLLALGGVTLQIHDAVTGKELRRLGGADADVCALAFSPDGKTLAAAPWGKKDGPVRLWDVAAGKELRQYAGHGEERITDLAFSPDGSALAGVVAVGSGIFPSRGWSEVVVWEAMTGKLRWRYQTPRKDGRSVAFTPDGKTLFVGNDHFAGTVWLLDAATGRELPAPAAHSGIVTSVSFSPDGKTLVTGSRDGTARLWEIATGKELRRLGGGELTVESVWFTPDGREVVTGGQDTVRRWDVRTGKELRTYDHPDGIVWSLALSPDGRTLAGAGFFGTYVLWDTATGEERGRWEGAAMPWHFCYSPDGGLLAADGTPREVSTRKPPPHFRELRATFVAFSDDGRAFVTIGPDKDGPPAEAAAGRVWEVATGAERARLTLPRQQSASYHAALSPDGNLLAVADRGGKLHLLDVRTNREVHQFPGHRDWLWHLAFSPDGKRLASASWDTTLLVWEVPPTPKPKAAPLAAEELKRLWDDLIGEDAARAYRAILRLADSPGQSVPMLKQRLRPAPRVDGQRVGRLVRELDDKQFKVRERAAAELKKLGVEAVRTALALNPTLEARRRLEKILEVVEGNKFRASGEELRGLRALEALERAGSAEARALLRMLADGEPLARLTREARASLARLDRHGRQPGP